MKFCYTLVHIWNPARQTINYFTVLINNLVKHNFLLLIGKTFVYIELAIDFQKLDLQRWQFHFWKINIIAIQPFVIQLIRFYDWNILKFMKINIDVFMVAFIIAYTNSFSRFLSGSMIYFDGKQYLLVGLAPFQHSIRNPFQVGWSFSH